MYLIPVLVGMGAVLICFFAEPIGQALRVIDVPDGVRKNHRWPTPLVGGPAIIVPMICAAIAIALIGDQPRLFGSLAAAMGGFFAIGFVDDRHNLRPSTRLILSLLLTLIFPSIHGSFAVAHLDFTLMDQAVSIGSWQIVFSVLAMVGLVYAFNMTDGIDGLAMGIAGIWVALLLTFATGALFWFLLALLVAVAITFVANLQGRLFLGDSGTYALAIVIGLLTIYSYNTSAPELKADVVVVWLIIPILDCLRLVITRLIEGRSPLSPDRTHLHHLLCRLVSHRSALLIYLAMIGAPGGLAVLFPAEAVLWLAVSLLCYGFFLTLALRRPEPKQSAETAPPGD